MGELFRTSWLSGKLYTGNNAPEIRINLPGKNQTVCGVVILFFFETNDKMITSLGKEDNQLR